MNKTVMCQLQLPERLKQGGKRRWNLVMHLFLIGLQVQYVHDGNREFGPARILDSHTIAGYKSASVREVLANMTKSDEGIDFTSKADA
jgi:hypothetical protein